MSLVEVEADPENVDATATSSEQNAPPPSREVCHEYTHSLRQLAVSLLVSTYQAVKFVAVGGAEGALTALEDWEFPVNHSHNVFIGLVAGVLFAIAGSAESRAQTTVQITGIGTHIAGPPFAIDTHVDSVTFRGPVVDHIEGIGEVR